MLSYQHAFHAGNHADVLKHFVLTYVIQSLNKKEKPYTFFDTHSASGLYDLLDNRSLKTQEAQTGILKLLNNCDLNNTEFSDFFNFVNQFTTKNLYPGSPIYELNFLRKQDFLVLSELHPQEIENLKINIENNKTITSPSVQIHKRNGWEMLNALTPPKTKRGAVLIDPSYEENQDYLDAEKTISMINKKWSNGIIMLWYPLISHKIDLIESMVQNITENAKALNPNIEIENLTLCVNEKDSHKEVSFEENRLDKKNPPRLYGSGMLVLNAPWKLGETTQNYIDFVLPYLI